MGTVADRRGADFRKGVARREHTCYALRSTNRGERPGQSSSLHVLTCSTVTGTVALSEYERGICSPVSCAHRATVFFCTHSPPP